MRKNCLKKSISLLLAAAILLSGICTDVAYASEPETDDPAVDQEETDGSPEETAGEDTRQQAEENRPDSETSPDLGQPQEEEAEPEEDIQAYADLVTQSADGSLEERYAIYFVAEDGESYTDTCTLTYTGKELTPEIIVVSPQDPDDILDISEDQDVYALEYEDNLHVGKAAVKVYEKEDPDHEISRTFTITWQSIADAKLTLSASSYTYDGSSKKPSVTVTLAGKTLVQDTDYTVSYSDNTKAGTAKVTVTGKGDYDGTASASFTIKAKSVSGAKLTLSKTSYTYDGNAKKPSVTAALSGKTLVKNTDYTVSYSSNTKVGTAKVTVTGKGNYSGTASTTFKIKLGTGKISSLTTSYNAMTVKWSKVAGADKYVIYRSTKKSSGFKSVKTIKGNSTFSYKDSGLTLGKTYYYKVRAYNGSTYTTTGVKSAAVKPAKAKVSKVSSSNYSTLKVTWSKVSGASGYYIYRSTSKSGTYKKIATVKKGSTTSYKDKKRTTGKTYYYKVAAYRTSKGKKYAGSKSDAVSGKAVPGKVTLSKVSQSSGKITVKWKKVSGAGGYEIYRSTSKSGTYKKVKTISSSKTVSWSNTGLTTGKTYYYKVRAYRTVSGKKVYGSYSSVKSVKLPLNQWDKLLNQYQDNSKVGQLIFVKYQGGSKASVVLYNKSGTSWKKVLTCTGYVGKNGIGKTKEGDKKTPTGTYNITGAFGIHSKPTTSLSYTKVNSNLYLCADKSHYNQLIDITKYPHNCTGEHLIDYPVCYKYGLFLDYNSSNTYGKGSAIFMHCTGSNKYTSGCIAVSESNMLKILSTLKDGAKICIYKE